jgi:hypothetical protein
VFRKTFRRFTLPGSTTPISLAGLPQGSVRQSRLRLNSRGSKIANKVVACLAPGKSSIQLRTAQSGLLCNAHSLSEQTL